MVNCIIFSLFFYPSFFLLSFHAFPRNTICPTALRLACFSNEILVEITGAEALNVLLWFDLASHTLMIYYRKSLIQVANASWNKEQVDQTCSQSRAWNRTVLVNSQTHEGEKKKKCLFLWAPEMWGLFVTQHYHSSSCLILIAKHEMDKAAFPDLQI